MENNTSVNAFHCKYKAWDVFSSNQKMFLEKYLIKIFKMDLEWTYKKRKPDGL